MSGNSDVDSGVDRARRGSPTGIARAMRVVAMLGMLGAAACAPEVDAPADHQRAIDRADGDRLAAELALLPGAVGAQVVLHRAIRDPLGTAPANAASAGAAIVVIVDDAADRVAVTADARRLVRAAAPEIADAQTELVVEVGAHRPTLATVGPFTVEAGSRTRLIATLAAALLVIAGLAGWLALRERRA